MQNIIKIICFWLAMSSQVQAIPYSEMASIPAGEFVMGSSDEKAKSNENPSHSVYLDSFYIDKFEVTQKEFKQIMNFTASTMNSIALIIGSNIPMIYVCYLYYIWKL